MEPLKIGQSLTPSQVRDLPDGAEYTIIYIATGSQYHVKVCGTAHIVPECGMYVAVEYFERFWRSATLVSLPSIEAGDDDTGTCSVHLDTYLCTTRECNGPQYGSKPSEPSQDSIEYLRKRNGVLENVAELMQKYIAAVKRKDELGNLENRPMDEYEYLTMIDELIPLPPVPENKSEPSPGDGYRWLLADIDRLRDLDQRKGSDGVWYDTGIIGATVGDNFVWRRRIEPQPLSNTKELPEAASEIEREAAKLLVHTEMYAIDQNASSLNVMAFKCRKYLDCYDYARSIGAIE